MKSALAFLALCIPVMAGDHFSYRPTRVTYEFGSPLPNTQLNLPGATMVVQMVPSDDPSAAVSMQRTRLASIDIDLGKARLAVPKEIIRDLGVVDASSLDLFWVGGRTWLHVRRHTDSTSADAELVWKDGVFVDFFLNGKSVAPRYPKLIGTPSKK